MLRAPEHAELAPAQVWARLLDIGVFLCSITTMYRILRAVGEVGDRRQQRTHPAKKKPELLATRPNQVWSWDIAGWIGEIGPGPSYGDVVEGSDVPMGYDSEFTNKNATIMSWNLMHTAKMLKDLGGFPLGGNVAATWRSVTNAADQDPDRT